MKQYIEKKTGLLFGTYRWREPSVKSGPPPLFGFVLRPANTEWVRLEVVFFGRAFYLTWGYEA